MDELTEALQHIKTGIEHQIRDLGASPPGSEADCAEKPGLEQIKYAKLLKSQLCDVEKAIELSLAAIRLRNAIGRGD